MILEKLPSLTGGWLVDELLDDGLLLEEGLLLLELELLLLLELEELLFFELELDGLLVSLDAGALGSESLEAGIEVLSIGLLGCLLS